MNRPDPLLELRPSQNDRAPRCATEAKHQELASAIARFARKRIVRLSTQHRKWAEALAVFDRQHTKGGSWEEIVELWTWYCSNYDSLIKMNPRRLPRIANAKQFRDRAQWIRDVMDRETGTKRVSRPVLCVQAKQTLRELNSLDWPKNADQTLASAVQTSIDNLNRFTAALTGHKTGDPTIHSAKAALSEVLGYGGADYVAQWFHRVWHDVKDWPAFNGDLTRYSWHETHRLFARDARAAVARVCGDESMYQELLTELNRGSNEPVR